MNKSILKISIIILFGILVINLMLNSSYAKYYIAEKLEAMDINIVLQNSNEGYE